MQLRRLVLYLILATGLSGPAHAGSFTALLQTPDGQPVPDAVLALYPLDVPPPKPATQAGAVMDQRGLRFAPHVLVVRAGTAVTFPNSDNVRHQVYSFSEPRQFELRLYSGRSAPPVLFDKPGIVILGCNIHDWMLGFIYVAETPYFAKSDAQGRTRLEGLPAGRYEVRLWHPRLAEQKRHVMGVVGIPLTGGAKQYTIELRPVTRTFEPPTKLENDFMKWRDVGQGA